MPVVSRDGQSFSGIAWTFKLLPSKHTDTSTFYRPVCGLIE
jgi:hypothetical protein